MEKKHKISISMVLLIIAIVIIAIMAFFIYQLYNDKQTTTTTISELNDKINNLEKNQDDKTDKSNNQSLETDKIEQLDINDDLVKQLHGYILKSDDFGNGGDSSSFAPVGEHVSFYKDSKVTYSSLSDAEKTLVVLKNYSQNEVKQVNKSQLKNIIKIDGIHDIVNVYDNLSSKAMKIFNQTNINWKDYDGLAATLNYNNDCYYLVEYDGGGLGTCEYGYSEIQSAEKDQENLYIYDKFIYIDTTNELISEGDNKTHIYTSSNKTEDIGSEKTDEKVSQLYKKYESKLKTYKHTFKQREDGSYYWVSSEQVNQ